MPFKMPSIETHEYSTPTATNRDCPFSLGIMNLTRGEARQIVEFVRLVVTPQRSATLPAQPDPRGLPNARFMCRNGHALNTETEWCARCEAAGRDSEPRLWGRQKPKPVDEPVVLGNRFSGLDIE